jgi:hypothetical protein
MDSTTLVLHKAQKGKRQETELFEDRIGQMGQVIQVSQTPKPQRPQSHKEFKITSLGSLQRRL